MLHHLPARFLAFASPLDFLCFASEQYFFLFSVGIISDGSPRGGGFVRFYIILGPLFILATGMCFYFYFYRDRIVHGRKWRQRKKRGGCENMRIVHDGKKRLCEGGKGGLRERRVRLHESRRRKKEMREYVCRC